MAFKQTIAVVNDERNILISLRLALENLGYNVRTYRDPLTALQELTARPADLAILNGRMPHMHGIELFRRLREHSDLPVIFLSASAEEIGETLRAPDMTADDYIQIPFSQRHLIERVAVRLSVPSA
jgi:two-component system, OmpR family, response regulator ChvI